MKLIILKNLLILIPLYLFTLNNCEFFDNLFQNQETAISDDGKKQKNTDDDDDQDNTNTDQDSNETARPEFSNTYYINASATGSNDGSDWSNAWTQIPAVLQRDSNYYIADGIYDEYNFNDGLEDNEYILITKATETDHGNDTGWQSEYGDGESVIKKLQINNSYFYIDGQSGKKLVIKGKYQSSALTIRNSNNVIVLNCDIDGNFQTDSSGYHSGGSCAGLDIVNCSKVTISNCHIHNAADDGVGISNSSEIQLLYNQINGLHGYGTNASQGKGPCYNGHSDGLEIYNTKNSKLIGNFVYDVKSTSALFFANWTTDSNTFCENIELSNNIFYTPETSFVAYFSNTDGLKLYHNTFWGQAKGRYGGISMGSNVKNVNMYNNIILSINYSHGKVTYDSTQHKGDYNLFGRSTGEYTEQANDIVNSDPGFTNIPDINGDQVHNPDISYFRLKNNSLAINKGFSGNANITLSSKDIQGSDRDNKPDIGAVEYLP